jgi:hypothetical protein
MQNQEIALYRENVKSKIKILTESCNELTFEKASDTIQNNKFLKCKNVEKVFTFLDSSGLKITGYKMYKNGYIFPHSHEFDEKLIVISGYYYDDFTKKTYYKDEHQIIERETLHSMVSDECFFISVEKNN